MTRPTRLLLLALPLALSLLATHSGRAQNASTAGGRFAFSDTTLLRDTLNLHFDELFPLADSLGVIPDSLRAWSIRFRLPLRRMTYLADSLRMPVDSVGVVMRREQFNPLATGVRRQNDFTYRSGYDIQQTSNNWNNGIEWRYARNSIYLNNLTDISTSRQDAGLETSHRREGTSTTEGGWRFSDRLSVGGRAMLYRFASRDPGDLNSQTDQRNEYQLSARTKQQPTRNLGADFAFFSGLLDQRSLTQVKRGLSADFSGHSRYTRKWISHDITGRLSGNLARTRLPSAESAVATRDAANYLDGTLNTFENSAISTNVNYGIRRVRVETLIKGDTVQQVRTDTDKLLATVRLRRDNERYLSVTERLGRSTNATATDLSRLNERGDQSLGAQLRWRLLQTALDVTFDHTYSDTRYPNRGNLPNEQSGYGDKSSNRSLNAIASRPVGRRLLFRAEGRVGLSVSRYYPIGRYENLPVDRDQYRQSYRIQGSYTISPRATTDLSLDVTRLKQINIPSASTGANSETRTYRAVWNWSYRLLPGLTANQINSLSADYVTFDFLPANNRVSLIYNITTKLNATLTPRTTFEITHNSQNQPSGNYTQFPDGESYFSKADENRILNLGAAISYRPAEVFSLNLQSTYYTTERSVSVAGGGQAPQRGQRALAFSGGALLDVPLGAGGHLTGDLSRIFRADQAIGFQNGIAVLNPATERDYWSGRMGLTWELGR